MRAWAPAHAELAAAPADHPGTSTPTSHGRWKDPCAGHVDVVLGPQAGADWLASTLPSQCRITLSDREPWPWGRLCPVLLHEYGHVAGYTDPTNPLDPHHSGNRRSSCGRSRTRTRAAPGEDCRI